MSAKPENERERIARIIDAYAARTLDIVSLMIRGDITKDARNEANERALQEALDALIAQRDSGEPMPEPVAWPPETIARLSDMAEFFEEATDPFIAESVCREHAADLRTVLALDMETIKREAYKQGWNDREGDFMVAMDRIYPDAQAEAQARVEETPRDFLRRFGQVSFREGSRADYVTAANWTDYVEVETDVLKKIMAALLSGSTPNPARVEITEAMVERAHAIIWPATEWNDGEHACRELVKIALTAALSTAPAKDGEA